MIMKDLLILSEASLKKRVKIAEGPYKGEIGTMVFSKLLGGDMRYYVIELDNERFFKDHQPPVVTVYNGQYDFI